MLALSGVDLTFFTVCLSVFLITTCRCWRAVFRSPWNSLPCWTSPTASAQLVGQLLQPLASLGSSAEFTSVSTYSVLEPPGWDAVSRIPKSSAGPCLLRQYLCFYFDFMCSFFRVSQVFCPSYTRLLHQEFLIYNKIPQHRQYSVTLADTPQEDFTCIAKELLQFCCTNQHIFFNLHYSETLLDFCILYKFVFGTPHSKLTPSLKKICLTKSM